MSPLEHTFIREVDNLFDQLDRCEATKLPELEQRFQKLNPPSPLTYSYGRMFKQCLDLRLYQIETRSLSKRRPKSVILEQLTDMEHMDYVKALKRYAIALPLFRGFAALTLLAFLSTLILCGSALSGSPWLYPLLAFGLALVSGLLMHRCALRAFTAGQVLQEGDARALKRLKEQAKFYCHKIQNQLADEA